MCICDLFEVWRQLTAFLSQGERKLRGVERARKRRWRAAGAKPAGLIARILARRARNR